MKLCILLTIICDQLVISQGLVSYQSLDPPKNDTNWDSGIKFLKDSIVKQSNFTKGITICTSFNFQTIDDYESWILSVDGLTIALKTAYEETGLFFSGMGWIVKDLQTNSFQLWAPNKWHHFCLSFDKNSSHIRLIKVSGIQLGVVQKLRSY